jgi:hypothetical protein
MIRSVSVIFITLIFSACRHHSPLTEREKSDIAEDIRKTLRNYHNDIRQSGLVAEFQYLDSASDFFWVPPGYGVSLSYDSVAAILKQNAPKYRSVDNSFDTLRIIPLSKEYASYTAHVRSTITDTTGQTKTFSLIETGVLVKRNNGWKLLHGQTSVLNN